MEEEVSAIVIDNGTGYCKAGLAGEEAPRTVVPSLIGRPLMQGVLKDLDTKEYFFGDESLKRKGLLKIS